MDRTDPHSLPLTRGSPVGTAGQQTAHESAAKHVSGAALYVDDIPTPADALHAYVGLSTVARGRLCSLNLDSVRRAPGVVDVLTCDDIPGHKDIGPVYPGDPLLLGEDDEIEFHGQVLFCVAAESYDLARRAAQLAEVVCDPLPPVLSIEEGLAAESFVRPSHAQRRGEVGPALDASPHRLKGELRIGGQEQMYLEGQVSLCIPEE
ncbi:MAG: xanthine dehydrogenase molybdopterin binding subunit, partial [Pseudomonadota bacterium]